MSHSKVKITDPFLWPSYRAFSMCTDVGLNITRIICFNKQWTYGHSVTNALKGTLRMFFYCFIWHTTVPPPITVAMWFMLCSLESETDGSWEWKYCDSFVYLDLDCLLFLLGHWQQGAKALKTLLGLIFSHLLNAVSYLENTGCCKCSVKP